MIFLKRFEGKVKSHAIVTKTNIVKETLELFCEKFMRTNVVNFLKQLLGTKNNEKWIWDFNSGACLGKKSLNVEQQFFVTATIHQLK